MMKRISALLMLGAIVLTQAHRARAEDQDEGKKLYQTYCTGCHGISEKGDGPAVKTLPVKPADHTRASVMSKLTDEYLFEVISKGGARVGKSSQMPGWGAVLKEAQIHDVVGYIRALGAVKKDPAHVRREISRGLASLLTLPAASLLFRWHKYPQ
jgi:mono/diheme cytochrome c family protein